MSTIWLLLLLSFAADASDAPRKRATRSSPTQRAVRPAPATPKAQPHARPMDPGLRGDASPSWRTSEPSWRAEEPSWRLADPSWRTGQAPSADGWSRDTTVRVSPSERMDFRAPAFRSEAAPQLRGAIEALPPGAVIPQGAVRTAYRERPPSTMNPIDLRAPGQLTAPGHSGSPHDPGSATRPPPETAPQGLHHDYKPRYTGWGCHPYGRHYYTTTRVVWFGYDTWAWDWWWTPPYRAGWVWVSGRYTVYGWYPGYWRPIGHAPRGYAYVSGYWLGDLYVEGYWRVERRRGAWIWNDGRYLANGAYLPGHWKPSTPAPAGYVWEPGFWDGGRWIEGFWRPESRAGYHWVAASFDADGVYRAGHWRPHEDLPGQVWIPGWFDGTRWVEGYWVDEAEWEQADLESWESDALPPLEGADDLIDTGGLDEDLPLGLPVH